MQKGQGLPLNTIIIAIIVVIVAVILIFIFRTYISREAEYVGLQLKGFEDCDCDGVADFLDDCDFNPDVSKLEKDQKECPGIKGADETQCIRNLPQNKGKCPLK
ncbi:hypothetical protein KY337_02580 [Candidatus Woesearchaeota archaeon]|nr:hypothetical protein [Candidatus Woesearchaeota archaeon]